MKSKFDFFFETSEENIQKALRKLFEENVIERIWQKDHTVWKEDPREIRNRLDWLSIAREIKPQLGELKDLASTLYEEGFRQVILLGMGGSSLAPELFSRVFPPKRDALELLVLDTTDPETVSWYTERARQRKTLYLVSTKSGNTLETLMLFRHFFAFVQQKPDAQNAGRYFVAITDPGSPLVNLAQKHHFRKIFLNNPNIGGRYSAFSFFGLVPAALAGVDLSRLLDSVEEGMKACSATLPVRENPGALLGSMMGVLAQEGKDKLTFLFLPEEWKSFGDWLEQLIAESTGKEGKGILPVVEPFPQNIDCYGSDRWFVLFSYESDISMGRLSRKMREKGYPLLHIKLPEVYTLGEQMFLWEFATAVAGHFLEINPFDQPNVEETKIFTKKKIENHQISLEESVLSLGETIQILPANRVSSPREALRYIFSLLAPDGYIALQAFLPYRREVEEELWKMAILLRDKTCRAVTVGFGPRFLHSTGQLHKGDAGKGVFLQFLNESSLHLPVPGESFDFAFLKKAQALGDREALRNRGRQVTTFLITGSVPEALTTIRELLATLPFPE